MKLKKFIIFALLILIVSATFTACNTGGNLPSDGTVNVETATDGESATQSESGTSQEDATQGETSASVYYSKEEDDLEIMTVPADDSDNNDSEDKGEETPATNAVIEIQPDDDKDNKEETRIELPFIPAN
ncbi:MAG: hypothetical protein IJ298_07160 [Ruminococcus sp.]|nr:hypothetical protein [Ruminococcus sp.]